MDERLRLITAKRSQDDLDALESWLRSRGGQPWFEGIVLECIERFPELDRFQVSEVIYKLRDEQSAALAAHDSTEAIERFGVDITTMSAEALSVILRRHNGYEAGGEDGQNEERK